MKTGITTAKIPFDSFQPTIRANEIKLPLKFDRSSIVQLQLLYSKFGISGKLNNGFNEGDFRILLHSISAYS